jgi:Heparan-alpha-glucosaminide N-acetyltransferase, catalytic
MSGSSSSVRIASMDQFRGYTVAGMFVVNFLASFAVIHPLLKHNQIYFSYADSIMPSFLFAVGFSFRLTYLKRIQQAGYWSTVWTYVKRSLALVVLSLVMYGFGSEFNNWKQFGQMPPEFEPFRPKASRTKSFDHLLAKARQSDFARGERAAVELATETALWMNDPEGLHLRPSDRKEAAGIAEQEAREFIGPALQRIRDWEALSPNRQLLVHLRIAVGKLVKADLWETLAIIGVTQLVVLPFVGRGFLARFLVLVALGIVHVVISYGFNWDFVYGINDNGMSKFWMTGQSRSWDGGFFGPLCWAIAMLAGTLAYDLVAASATHRTAAIRLLLWGIAFMAAGYAMSCLTRAYELAGPELEARRVEVLRRNAERNWLQVLLQTDRKLPADNALNPPNRNVAQVEPMAKSGSEEEAAARIQVLGDQQEAIANLELAESPVWPPWERLKNRTWREWLVEPPFVAPPRDDPGVASPAIEHRPWNYWMMGKRMPSLSFMTFASGFAFALYGLFVLACDAGGLSVGIFRTFGTNALVAYFLHHVIEEQVQKLVPHDAPLWYCLCGFSLFFLLTYACVRYLEKQKIYVKL